MGGCANSLGGSSGCCPAGGAIARKRPFPWDWQQGAVWLSGACSAWNRPKLEAAQPLIISCMSGVNHTKGYSAYASENEPLTRRCRSECMCHTSWMPQRAQQQERLPSTNEMQVEEAQVVLSAHPGVGPWWCGCVDNSSDCTFMARALVTALCVNKNT